MKRLSLAAEVLVFGAAMACLGSLLATWTFFFRHITKENFRLRSELAILQSKPDAVERALAKISEEYARQNLQVTGEGSLFLLCLVVCVITLFVVARQHQRAKERMQRMLALTTHELKTPIAGVRALLQSLQLGTVPEESRPRLLAHGLSECDRLEHLSETILAYQRALRPEHKPLERIDVGELLARVIEHRGDAPTTAVATELWAMGDPDSFRVIVENLLDNARKYGAGKPVSINHKAHAGVIQLTVSDQGIGFMPEDGQRIFDVFSRGPGSQGQHGSGLGLYLSRQLARQMGGRLVAHSDGPGQGATFTLELRPA